MDVDPVEHRAGDAFLVLGHRRMGAGARFLAIAIRQRVQAARHIVPMILRERQLERFAGTNIICNADMCVAEVRKFCKLDETGDSLVRVAMSQLNLSA